MKSAETVEAELGKTYEEATKKVDDEKAKVALSQGRSERGQNKPS